MKILDTQILKTNWNLVRFSHNWECGCKVHYSTIGKIQDAQVVWADNNPKCTEKTHRKQRWVRAR